MKLFRFLFAILLLCLMAVLIFFQHIASFDMFEENCWYFYVNTAVVSAAQFPILWFIQRFSFRKWMYPTLLLLYLPGIIWHLLGVFWFIFRSLSILGLPLPAFCLTLDIAAMVYTGHLYSKENPIPNSKDV